MSTWRNPEQVLIRSFGPVQQHFKGHVRQLHRILVSYETHVFGFMYVLDFYRYGENFTYIS